MLIPVPIPTTEPWKLEIAIGNLAEQHFPGSAQIVDKDRTRQRLWDMARRLNGIKWPDQPGCTRSGVMSFAVAGSGYIGRAQHLDNARIQIRCGLPVANREVFDKSRVTQKGLVVNGIEERRAVDAVLGRTLNQCQSKIGQIGFQPSQNLLVSGGMTFETCVIEGALAAIVHIASGQNGHRVQESG